MKPKALAFLKNPVYLIFAVLYFSAVLLRTTAGLGNLAVYLGMNLALAGLVWFVHDLTKKRPAIDVSHKEPALELALGLMIVEAAWYVIPPLAGLKEWDAGFIIRKNVINVGLVAALCLCRRTPLGNWRETKKNFRRDLGLGLFLLSLMAVPAAFYSGVMPKILNGSLKPSWLPGLLGISFVHNFFLAGLPEEVFYRGFIQSRLSAAFKNDWMGLAAASLYFGLIHTTGNEAWGYNAGFMGGFTESMFIQTFHGLVFGMLWMRTRSLLPGIILHSGTNAVTNLAGLAQTLGRLQ